jgi:hypothetical protein
MGKYAIGWGARRELKKFGFNIRRYYEHMIDRWNEMVKLRTWSEDERTRESKAVYRMMDSMIHLHDMIAQTEREHEERIKDIENKLKVWTSQQTGRKPKLTEEQKEQVRQMKARGESNRTIGRQFGVTEGTIRKILK